MRLYAISDLHLSLNSNKPMDRFGEHWHLHHEKIARAWDAVVRPDDIVLVPGDHSWALKLEDAAEDLRWIGARPGIKVMGKGNHDLWWHSLTRLQALGLPQTCWLQNNAYIFGRIGLCGTRGWSLPNSETSAQDLAIYAREKERLKLSFAELDKKRKSQEVDTIVCMLHYPPLLSGSTGTDFTELLEGYGVNLCVYGHMHRSHASRVFRGPLGGVRYEVVSCDMNDFAPLLLLDTEAAAVAAAAGEPQLSLS